MRQQLSFVAALLFLIPHAGVAQSEKILDVVIGLAVGFTRLPAQMTHSSCVGTTFPAFEAKAGVALGRWSIETRAAGFGAIGGIGCAAIIVPPHESGIHTDSIFPYDQRPRRQVAIGAPLVQAGS